MSERPQKLHVSFHARPWGAYDLSPWFPRPSERIGEVWLTAVPPLPLLIKFLFTTEALSVQVHPGGPQGKTEMWCILEAEPGASLALGFKAPITRERLRSASVTGEILNLLNFVPANKGDTVFIPAGTVHALGAGIRLVEIQQNCDVTYRLYDYNRGRELHLDRGVAVSRLGPPDPPPQPVRLDSMRTRLVHCEYFSTERWEIPHAAQFPPAPGTSHVLIGVEGTGRLNGESYHAGEAWLMPEGAPVEVEPERASVFLSTFAPVLVH